MPFFSTSSCLFFHGFSRNFPAVVTTNTIHSPRALEATTTRLEEKGGPLICRGAPSSGRHSRSSFRCLGVGASFPEDGVDKPLVVLLALLRSSGWQLLFLLLFHFGGLGFDFPGTGQGAVDFSHLSDEEEGGTKKREGAIRWRDGGRDQREKSRLTDKA